MLRNDTPDVVTTSQMKALREFK